jgi:hypothetical protein
MERNTFLHLTSSNTGQNNGILNFHLPHYRSGTKNDKRKKLGSSFMPML